MPSPSLAPPRRALEICAEDLDLSAHDLTVVDPPFPAELYLNPIFFVARKGAPYPDHVVKVSRSSAYSPRREFDALQLAERALRDRAKDAEPRLGVVHPVGMGSDPSFLVTRYQRGELALQAFDESLRGWRRSRPIETAKSHSRAIAHWLHAFRSHHSEAGDRGGGFEALETLRAMHAMAHRVGRQLGVQGQADQLAAHFERYVADLSDDDRDRLSRSYPNRGDARPKNFIAGSDGVFYALDLEAFGHGPLEHDLSCFHHYLEYQAMRSWAGNRRACMLWGEFWDTYMGLGNSPTFALLGYVHFLLERLDTSRPDAQTGNWRKRLRREIWIHNRLRWLDRLTGDLKTDACTMRNRV